MTEMRRTLGNIAQVRAGAAEGGGKTEPARATHYADAAAKADSWWGERSNARHLEQHARASDEVLGGGGKGEIAGPRAASSTSFSTPCKTASASEGGGRHAVRVGRSKVTR